MSCICSSSRRWAGIRAQMHPIWPRWQGLSFNNSRAPTPRSQAHRRLQIALLDHRQAKAESKFKLWKHRLRTTLSCWLIMSISSPLTSMRTLGGKAWIDLRAPALRRDLHLASSNKMFLYQTSTSIKVPMPTARIITPRKAVSIVTTANRHWSRSLEWPLFKIRRSINRLWIRFHISIGVAWWVKIKSPLASSLELQILRASAHVSFLSKHSASAKMTRFITVVWIQQLPLTAWISCKH